MHPPLVGTHQAIKMVHMHLDAAERMTVHCPERGRRVSYKQCFPMLSQVLNQCLHALGLPPRNG